MQIKSEEKMKDHRTNPFESLSKYYDSQSRYHRNRALINLALVLASMAAIVYILVTL